jgi:hypothetical protein
MEEPATRSKKKMEEPNSSELLEIKEEIGHVALLRCWEKIVLLLLGYGGL